MPQGRPTIYDRTGELVFCNFCVGVLPGGVRSLANDYCPDCGNPVCFWCLRIFKHPCGEVAESG